MGRSGIIYIMTTSVTGLIKIGKTENFKQRMAVLEQNGYWNVSGLHPFYAVRVKDYAEKEKLIHTVFSKSRVADSELFALDKHIAKEMLEAFDGEQVFPEVVNKPAKPKIIVEKINKNINDEPIKHEKNSKLTFEMIGIPVGSELVYVDDENINCITTDTINHVKYDDKIFTISALVTYIKKYGSWQGGAYFKYNGKRLTDIRAELGK